MSGADASSALMHGQSARQLVLELRRGTKLMPFNEDGVRKVVEEVKVLHEDVTSTIAESEGSIDAEPLRAALVLKHEAATRSKHGLLCYIENRARRVESLRWRQGAVLGVEERGVLGRTEVGYFRKYSDVLARYMGAVGFDLTRDLQPPKHLFVVVVATRDVGEVVLPYSQRTLTISKGETYCERRADLERFLIDGSMREVA